MSSKSPTLYSHSIGHWGGPTYGVVSVWGGGDRGDLLLSFHSHLMCSCSLPLSTFSLSLATDDPCRFLRLNLDRDTNLVYKL